MEQQTCSLFEGTGVVYSYTAHLSVFNWRVLSAARQSCLWFSCFFLWKQTKMWQINDRDGTLKIVFVYFLVLLLVISRKSQWMKCRISRDLSFAFWSSPGPLKIKEITYISTLESADSKVENRAFLDFSRNLRGFLIGVDRARNALSFDSTWIFLTLVVAETQAEYHFLLLFVWRYQSTILLMREWLKGTNAEKTCQKEKNIHRVCLRFVFPVRNHNKPPKHARLNLLHCYFWIQIQLV